MRQTQNKHDRYSIPGPHYLSKLPLVELEITSGRARNKRRRIREATYLFGSGRSCDLVLGDPQFEEVHGYLLLGPHGVMLRHLGFQPDLTVNGRPVRNILLDDNARIRTGPFEFRIYIRPNPDGPTASAEGDLEPFEAGFGMGGPELSPAGTRLRLFAGSEDRSAAGLPGAELPGASWIPIPRPPQWRHYSELILRP